MPRTLSVLSKDKLQELGFGLLFLHPSPPAASAASEARQAARFLQETSGPPCAEAPRCKRHTRCGRTRSRTQRCRSRGAGGKRRCPGLELACPIVIG
jgi:hypothetical protein